MANNDAMPINRRAFFGVAASSAAASTVMAVGGAKPAFAQTETGDERTRARYQLTEHVETYYRTNRYYPRGTN
ncbi:formate dehydrogenase region TAT target [Loktanella fryxellensis]|uniref:Formate dehydrogenase region TAT target n=1 Tax=Loktanella fryxellensis TaxID=245187 RepID=A0A1H8B5G0_9RHOB|nr:hypothetical protein [Loktanella fryxellensis]SEM77996.1 formate dehydrogenase region TAT target [Loktanella fryxellensis]